eukprot:TRINITY_DN4016_c0_g1_i2.p1 TRINITY_DN4016_c0_g1~~TRINITY_DN4016_c0_g1_i2.p1  ORF type:complete len:386 (-),score=57.74 TRINITY_DN4016_c0_g1_i2:548-1657(-)
MTTNKAKKTTKKPLSKDEALREAILVGNLIKVEDLIRAGANPRLEKDKHTPLTLAALRSFLPIVRYLVEQAGVKVTDEKRALHVAAMSNIKNKELMKFLVDMGADINHVDETLGTPLMLALHDVEGQPEKELFVEWMVKNLGADPSVHCKTGEQSSALHKACGSCSIELVKFLLDRGAKALVNAADARGFSPLTCTVVSKHRDKDKLLMMLIDEYGADPNYMQDFTPLFLAVQHGFTSTTELLLERGAYVNAVDKDMKCTPLHITISNNHLEIARLLLKHGATVDCEDKRGYTPLFMACAEGYVNGVKLLLENGANVNHAALSDNTTALFHAVCNYCRLLYSLLIPYTRSIVINLRSLAFCLKRVQIKV